MGWLNRIGRRPNRDSEIDRELQFHIEHQIDDYVRAGMLRADATRRTHLEFGGIQQVTEECREVFVVRWCDDIVRDARFAVRGFRRSPGFFLAALTTLALGIGANTAMFSLLDSLLLRQLPVRDPGRLAVLVDPAPADAAGLAPYGWSYPVFQQLEQRPELFDSLAAWSTVQFDLATGGETQFANGLWANGEFFKTLGVEPALGRTFSASDDRRGGGPDGAVAVISYDFWQRRFGGTASVIGRTLMLERVPFTIIGVTPRGFFGAEVGRAFDVIVPFGDEPLIYRSETRLDQRNRSWLYVIARLKPEQTLTTATTTLRGIQGQVRDATVPLTWTAPQRTQYLKSPFTLVSASTGLSGLRRRYERPLTIIMIVVGLVLLVACVNIANLLLARASACSREMSARRALGASRMRLLRQSLTESALLAVGGAACGLLLASWGSRFLARQLSAPPATPFLDLSINTHVLVFTIATAVVTALLFGAIPALRASRATPMGALKEGDRATAGGSGAGAARFLVVVQVALSLLLVVAAGLFLRTFVLLARHDMGFITDGVLVVDVGAQRANVDPSQRIPLFDTARQSVRTLPGVAEAGISLMSPVRGERLGNLIQSVSGGAPLPDSLPLERRRAMINLISPGWFNALGIRLISGRDFSEDDRSGAPLVAVVNQAFAQKFLAGANPLGHTVTLAFTGPQPISVQIVGVTVDAVYSSLRDSSLATMYFPLAQHQDFPFLASVRLSVRSGIGSPALLTRSVVAALTAVNPQFSLTVRPLSEQVDASMVQERVVAMLSGFFGGLALLLAGLGLYGVTSYGVTQRRSEIGIRMALGARSADVILLVLTQVAWVVGIGILIGAAVSAWASTFVDTLLYGLEPRDPATFIGAAIVLAAVATLAAWLPARRATRVDPMVALRCE